MKYVVVIEKSDNGYSAYPPDIPGCIAAAETFAETEKLIREAVVYHLEMMAESGEPIPEPHATAIEVEVGQPARVSTSST